MSKRLLDAPLVLDSQGNLMTVGKHLEGSAVPVFVELSKDNGHLSVLIERVLPECKGQTVSCHFYYQPGGVDYETGFQRTELVVMYLRQPQFLGNASQHDFLLADAFVDPTLLPRMIGHLHPPSDGLMATDWRVRLTLLDA